MYDSQVLRRQPSYDFPIMQLVMENPLRARAMRSLPETNTAGIKGEHA